MTSITSYRSQHAEVSDSDSSSSSDDGDQPWKRQKRKRGQKGREAPMAVSRPIERPTRPSSGTSASNKRKRNNIWGEVVQAQGEEQVARDMTQFDMHRNKERDVESYTYRRDDVERKPQPLGKPISFGDDSDVRNRKMPAALGGSNEDSWLVDDDGQGSEGTRIRDRLGPKTDRTDSEGEAAGTTFPSTMKAVAIESSMHKKEVAGQIAYSLQEPNREMVKTVVSELGTEKSIAVWEETCDIERNGGMMVNTGLRRRTPGGVFFYLLKMDPDISREKKDIIFAMSKLQAKQDSKDKRRKRRRAKPRNRGTQKEGKAESMEVEGKQEEKSTEQVEGTNLKGSGIDLQNVIDVVGGRKQDEDVMDSEMNQEQDDLGGDMDSKAVDGIGHGKTDKVEESGTKIEVEAEGSRRGDVKAEESEGGEESGSSSEEEEEADIGKAIERRLLEIKRQKEKSNENGKQKGNGGDPEKGTQKGDNCGGVESEQISVVDDAEMEEGEVSDY